MIRDARFRLKNPDKTLHDSKTLKFAADYYFDIYRMDKLFTIEETADLLRMSRMQLYRLRKRKKIESYQDGRAVTFSQAHIEKYLKAITKKSTAKGYEYYFLKDWQTLAGMTETEKHELNNEMFAVY